jgi:hypothetical protein
MSSRDGRTPRRSGGNCGFHLSREECESSILLVSGNISSHQIIVGWDIVTHFKLTAHAHLSLGGLTSDRRNVGRVGRRWNTSSYPYPPGL